MSPSNISQSGNHHKSYFMYWMLILNDMEIFFTQLHFLASKSVNFFNNIHMCLSIFSSSLNLVFCTPASYVCISWKQVQNILKKTLYNQKQGGNYNLLGPTTLLIAGVVYLQLGIFVVEKQVINFPSTHLDI